VATHGIEAATEAAEFEAENLAAVKKVIENEGIDCDFVYTRAVDALMSDEIFQKIKSGVDLLKKNGVSVIDDVYFAEGTKAEQVSCHDFRVLRFAYADTFFWHRSRE
jgi:hypothetical protein